MSNRGQGRSSPIGFSKRGTLGQLINTLRAARVRVLHAAWLIQPDDLAQRSQSIYSVQPTLLTVVDR